LKDECPALTIQAFTSAGSYELYNAASDYYRKPEDASSKKKLMDGLNKHCLTASGESDGDQHCSLQFLGEGSSDTGASLIPADRSQVQAAFQKNALVLNEDGTLKLNDASALKIFSAQAGLTVEEGASSVVAVDDLFKNAEVTANGSPTANTIVAGLDAAAAKGGGSVSGCALASENTPAASPIAWTLALGVLTLMAWRFRPHRRRASIVSSRITRAKGSSTKN
jgi:MYXO-CTERM domain-containing protein